MTIEVYSDSNDKSPILTVEELRKVIRRGPSTDKMKLRDTSFGSLFHDKINKMQVVRDEEKVDDIIIYDCGTLYFQFHDQDCCENVRIEDIVGDLQDIVGSTILESEEIIKEGEVDCSGSSTWTYYKLGTIKGHVNIRWYGSSNGCYSETVNFYIISSTRKIEDGRLVDTTLEDLKKQLTNQ